MAQPRAWVIGTGLIGGSIGMALRQAGWHVSGTDDRPERVAAAQSAGALDAVGEDGAADVTFVATPVGDVPAAARRALEVTASAGGLVTDVGSVKAAIVDAITDPRFVGGHPMAGSEQDGIDGADPSLFAGALWVLTPTDSTDPADYARLRAVIGALGADVVAMPADRHDMLVALVSHVPHLTAAALMCLAAERAEEHTTVLRLAAGGFRDMTRIASGHPGIWPDICAENRDAIVDGLDRLLSALGAVRESVAGRDRAALLDTLQRARAARISLPARAAARADELVELRVPVPDRPGVIAEVTTLAGELGVNVHDLEVAHSAEGVRGLLVLVIDADARDLLRGALLARGYRPSFQSLGAGA